MLPAQAGRGCSSGAVAAIPAERRKPLWVERSHGNCAVTDPIQPATANVPAAMPSHPVFLFTLLSFTSSPTTILEASGKQKGRTESGSWSIITSQSDSGS